MRYSAIIDYCLPRQNQFLLASSFYAWHDVLLVRPQSNKNASTYALSPLLPLLNPSLGPLFLSPLLCTPPLSPPPPPPPPLSPSWFLYRKGLSSYAPPCMTAILASSALFAFPTAAAAAQEADIPFA